MYKIPAKTLFIGQKLIYVPECHSTNSLLNELNDQSELPEGTVVITNHQAAGRGQRGNTWEAQRGMNLTFSILLRPKFLQAKDQFGLNMAVSLAIADSLQSCLPQGIKLKWPNDILVDDKKIGGILIESQLQSTSVSCCIVGLGLNVNQQRFSHPGASSIYNFSGAFHNLNDLFQRLIESVEGKYLELRTGKTTVLKQRYLDSLYKFNEPHQFESSGENFTGSISDVDEHGKLCIESQGMTRRFSFKEVKFLNGWRS